MLLKSWAKLKETYDKLDWSIILNLLQKIHNFKQGELTVFEYYHMLNSLWREFDIMTKLPKCSCDARDDVLKHNQLMRLMQFLIGLNDVYQPLRSSLLSRKTLSDVKDAFAIIYLDKSLIEALPHPLGMCLNLKSLVLGPNLNLLCKIFGKVDHTIERCFDIIGYPPGYNKNSSKSDVKSKFNANVELNETSTHNSPTLSFTNDQMMKLMSLINDMPFGAIQANMASKASLGANQHMTITTKYMFEVIDISDLNLTVGHPNGTMAKIKYVRNLQLSKDVVLYDILVVPGYCLIPINRGLIQAIPSSLPPQPIGEATKASNLRRIPPGVQGRSHFTYFLYLIVQIRIL
ncbi:hypothetical protein Tco_1173841 [Tanacetum coccineum]